MNPDDVKKWDKAIDTVNKAKYEQTKDLINHPHHYTHSGIECIDAIRAALTDEEFRGYCKGNMFKYIWRERYKGGDSDLEKAATYQRFLFDREQEKMRGRR